MVPKPFCRTRFPLASYGRLVTVLSVRLAKLTELLTPENWVWLNVHRLEAHPDGQFGSMRGPRPPGNGPRPSTSQDLHDRSENHEYLANVCS